MNEIAQYPAREEPSRHEKRRKSAAGMLTDDFAKAVKAPETTERMADDILDPMTARSGDRALATGKIAGEGARENVRTGGSARRSRFDRQGGTEHDANPGPMSICEVERMYENLIWNANGPVVVLQLHRPSKKNTFNAQLRMELGNAVTRIKNDPALRAVIITGGEEIFSAGADIGELQGAASCESIYKHAKEFQDLFDQIENLPQPVIAAVSGYALGGGCELALACDFRIASDTAKFALSEVKIGAFPGGGGTQRLPRLIGTAKAKEIIFIGDVFGAADALASGLLLKVVPKEKLLEEAGSFAAKLAALPRLALEASKRVINRGMEMDITSALELEARSLAALATSHDLKEGTLAFMQKRKPSFTGE
jgi:enoyl-CoA hydratase